MGKLKLFISHSSRLDDQSVASDAEITANWTLLEEVCDGLRKAYPDQVEILVDRSIGKGEDWEKCLNEWLHECHAAIILYSKRAINYSDWVRKEATILNWRWQTEKNFALLPVYFDGETEPDNFDDSYWVNIGAPQINSVTTEKDSGSILTALSACQRFNELLATQLTDIPTPFSRIAQDITDCLDDDDIFPVLRTAWNKLDDTDMPDTEVNSASVLAANLVRFLLRCPDKSLERLDAFCRELTNHREARERMQNVFSEICALWVDSGAAACLHNTMEPGHLLALNGIHQNCPHSLGRKSHFTVERYIKRAWYKDKKGLFVPLDGPASADEIEQKMFEEARIANPRSRIENLRSKLKNKDFILLYLSAVDESLILPDTDYLEELEQVRQTYERLRVVLGIGEHPLDDIPEGIMPVEPALDADFEDCRYIDDEALIDFFSGGN